MIEWSRIPKDGPIDWLLEKSNPSVRYFAMRDVLGRPEDDSGVATARNRNDKATVHGFWRTLQREECRQTSK